MTNDPRILFLAFVGGIIPSLLWLWFWLREDKKNPEPKSMLLIVFLLGMLAVICVLPIQEFIQDHVASHNYQLVLWVTSEEIIKFLIVAFLLYNTRYLAEPINWPIYLITAALGFAALENALFLLKPLSQEQNTVGLLTGQLRFLGSTLLHTVSSGILGIALGFSLHMQGLKKIGYAGIGLVLAIALHSVFNFFIIKIRIGDENYLLEVYKVFGFLWVVTIIVMLLFEKVRRMN